MGADCRAAVWTFSCVDAATTLAYLAAWERRTGSPGRFPANAPRFFFTGHNCHGAGYEYTFYGAGKDVPPRRACRQSPQNSFAWKSATYNEKDRRPPGGTSEPAALFPTNRIGAEYCAAGEAGELSVATGYPERPRCFHCKKLRGPMIGSEIGSKCGRAIAARKLSEATGRFKVQRQPRQGGPTCHQGQKTLLFRNRGK